MIPSIFIYLCTYVFHNVHVSAPMFIYFHEFSSKIQGVVHPKPPPKRRTKQVPHLATTRAAPEDEGRRLKHRRRNGVTEHR